MSSKAAFVYDHTLSAYQIPEDHPLTPKRLRWTFELLQYYKAFDNPCSILVKPRAATEKELLAFHTREYVEAVKAFSRGERMDAQFEYGFSDFGDNPSFPGMYEAACLSVGATMVATELVESGQVDVAFNIAGGLHHALSDRTSGFCIFNDPVIAITHLIKKDRRVAYVDIDAHHGDGVQEGFYDDPHVLTVSMHESGRYLFPGTGFTDEIGEGKGRGYAVNLPLHPYTGDDAYLYVFREVVLPLLHAFKPDVLFTQLGVDTHYNDPLTHLKLTTKAFVSVLTDFHRLDLPWVATGGGGYEPGVTARCWALAYGVMAGRQWPDDLPPTMREQLGASKLRDMIDPIPLDNMKEAAQRHAEQVVARIKATVFPIHRLS
jgi:acetoin utilization protein AcuC